MTTALAVRHGAFGRATLNRLGRPLATHAHREGHVIVTLRGTGSAIVTCGDAVDADAASGDARADRGWGDANGRSAERVRASDPVDGWDEGTNERAGAALRLPLEPGCAVLIDSWRPHRFAPGPGAACEFLTLYLAPEWFAALASEAPGADADALRFGAARVALDDALAGLADDAAAMLAARRRWDHGADGCERAGHGAERADADGFERTLAALTRGLHDRSWSDGSQRGGAGRGAMEDVARPEHRVDGPIRLLPEIACDDRAAHGDGDGDGGVAHAHVSRERRKARADRTVADFRIRRALRLMREAVAVEGDVDLVRTARGAGLSRPHFFKLFRTHMGVTPGTFVSALKMERAHERLTTGSDTVTAIGLDLGFASQASFTRFFIAQGGIAPSDYREATHASGGIERPRVEARE